MKLNLALVIDDRIVAQASELQILAAFTAAGLRGDDAAEALNRLKATLTAKVRRVG